MILDRMGLSSRSGTLLKFSLLVSEEEKHQEENEKKADVSQRRPREPSRSLHP